MIAAEEDQYRRDQEHIGKIVGPIFEEAIIERNQKNNQRLGRWIY